MAALACLLLTILVRLFKGPRRGYAAVSFLALVIGVAALLLSTGKGGAWAHVGGVGLCLGVLVASLAVCGDIRDAWHRSPYTDT